MSDVRGASLVGLWFACFHALACAGGAPDGGPSQASAGMGGATTPPAAGSRSTFPNSPPSTPIYEVPVTDPGLAPFATFAIGSVDWKLSGGNASLEYVFPAALSGIGDQQVSFHGSVAMPDTAELSGAQGTAVCHFSNQTVRCTETMTGLATAPQAAQRMLQALPAQEQLLRGQVIQAFSSDPIGIITFANSDDN